MTAPRSAVVLALLLPSAAALALPTGPAAGHANDPPNAENCTACHDSFALNAGAVTLSLVNTGGSTLSRYRPGTVRPLTFSVATTQGGRGAFGFQLTALAGTTMAGSFTAGTGQRIVTGSGRQYLDHSTPGTGSASGHSWSFTWTTPATDVGQVVFYACANAANGTGTSSGDYIECSTFSIAPVPADDPDDDGTGPGDNCPLIPNPAQEDADQDGFGDACDVCPGVADGGQADLDGDGIGDACDLCAVFVDPLQQDADLDGVGDACEIAWGDVAPRAAPDGMVTVTDVVQELRYATQLDAASPREIERGNIAPASIDAGPPEVATPTLAAPRAVEITDVVLMLRVAVGLTQLASPR